MDACRFNGRWKPSVYVNRIGRCNAGIEELKYDEEKKRLTVRTVQLYRAKVMEALDQNEDSGYERWL